MSIRSRQKLIGKIMKVGLVIVIIAGGWFISSETYRVAQSIKQIEANMSAIHEYVDEWVIE